MNLNGEAVTKCEGWRTPFKTRIERNEDMAKKSSSTRKPDIEAEMEESGGLNEAAEPETQAGSSEERTPAKPKAKAKEDPGSNANVGIADIRKAAAFANSVGGLDKAMALLQILKVAKEVQ